jgi:hypothetical protein
MHSFSMRPAKYFYGKPLPKYLDPKTILIYRPDPVLYYREWIFKYKNLHDFEGKVDKVYSVFSREQLSQKYLYLRRRSLQKR